MTFGNLRGRDGARNSSQPPGWRNAVMTLFHRGELNAAEHEFIENMSGWSKPSARQLVWLQYLWRRHLARVRGEPLPLPPWSGRGGRRAVVESRQRR